MDDVRRYFKMDGRPVPCLLLSVCNPSNTSTRKPSPLSHTHLLLVLRLQCAVLPPQGCQLPSSAPAGRPERFKLRNQRLMLQGQQTELLQLGLSKRMEV